MIVQLIHVRRSGYRLDDLDSIHNRNFSCHDHIVNGPGIIFVSAAVAVKVTLPMGTGTP